MIPPREIYGELLTQVGSLLASHGFRRARTTFHRRLANGNWTIVNFQTSSKSSQTQVVFTINLGAASNLLARFFDGQRLSKPPTVDRCHWNTRLGFLLPDRQDIWWVIDRETDPNRIKKKVVNLLRDDALPILEVVSSDEGLRDLWLQRRESSPFVPDLTRYEYLIVLTTALGPPEAKEMAIAQMREIAAKSHGLESAADDLLGKLAQWRDTGQLAET